MIRRLKKVENHAPVAFQLLIASRQAGMRLECDYTSERVEKELSIMRKAVDELFGARGFAREFLVKRISNLRGAPLVLAEPVETEEAKGAVVVLDTAVKVASRINPVRARQAAKNRLASEKADLRDEMGSDDTVKVLAEKNEMELEILRFAFNEAKAIVIEYGIIRTIPSRAPVNEGGMGETAG